MTLKIWNKIRLNQIRNDAKNSLFKDFNGREKERKTVYTFLYVIPCIITAVLLLLGVFIQENTATYLITGVSIFAGLFFGLLFVINEKYNSRKSVLGNSKYEDTQKYLKRYKNFATQLISQISYTIVIAFGLIILMSITYFSTSIDWTHILSKISHTGVADLLLMFLTISKYLINALIFYLCSQFILFVIVILGNTYVMLMDDLNFDPE